MGATVFILGRPGSGKSTAARYLTGVARRRNFSPLFLQDYDILYRMFLEEPTKFRPTDCGGFDVLDFSVLDSALRQLEANVQASLAGGKADIALIEFARNDYRAALHLFHPAFLREAYFFFIDSDLEECIRRVRKRATEPLLPDNHFVSEHIMRTYYVGDDCEYMAHDFAQEFGLRNRVVVTRNDGPIEKLLDEVDTFAEEIFSREFSALRR
jgi:energy-coupling factor transporter ATP-binding protein EcfA2